MTEPTREQIYALAAKHSDAQQHSRDRALQGWNFSKDGLLAFAREVRLLEATPEQAMEERWREHIKMERGHQANRGDVETGSGFNSQCA